MTASPLPVGELPVSVVGILPGAGAPGAIRAGASAVPVSFESMVSGVLDVSAALGLPPGHVPPGLPPLVHPATPMDPSEVGPGSAGMPADPARVPPTDHPWRGRSRGASGPHRASVIPGAVPSPTMTSSPDGTTVARGSLPETISPPSGPWNNRPESADASGSKQDHRGVEAIARWASPSHPSEAVPEQPGGSFRDDATEEVDPDLPRAVGSDPSTTDVRPPSQGRSRFPGFESSPKGPERRGDSPEAMSVDPGLPDVSRSVAGPVDEAGRRRPGNLQSPRKAARMPRVPEPSMAVDSPESVPDSGNISRGPSRTESVGIPIQTPPAPVAVVPIVADEVVRESRPSRSHAVGPAEAPEDGKPAASASSTIPGIVHGAYPVPHPRAPGAMSVGPGGMPGVSLDSPPKTGGSCPVASETGLRLLPDGTGGFSMQQGSSETGVRQAQEGKRSPGSPWSERPGFKEPEAGPIPLQPALRIAPMPETLHPPGSSISPGPQILRFPTGSGVPAAGSPPALPTHGSPVPEDHGLEGPVVMASVPIRDQDPDSHSGPGLSRISLREGLPDPASPKPTVSGSVRADSNLPAILSLAQEVPDPGDFLRMPVAVPGLPLPSPASMDGISDPRSLFQDAPDAIPQPVAFGPTRHETLPLAPGRASLNGEAPAPAPLPLPLGPSGSGIPATDMGGRPKGFAGAAMVSVAFGESDGRFAPLPTAPTQTMPMSTGGPVSRFDSIDMPRVVAPASGLVLSEPTIPSEAHTAGVSQRTFGMVHAAVVGTEEGDAPPADAPFTPTRPEAAHRVPPSVIEAGPHPRQESWNAPSDRPFSSSVSANIAYDRVTITGPSALAHSPGSAGDAVVQIDENLRKTGFSKPAKGGVRDADRDGGASSRLAGTTSAVRVPAMVVPQESMFVSGPVRQRPDSGGVPVESGLSVIGGGVAEPSSSWQWPMPTRGEPTPMVVAAASPELPVPKMSARLQELLSGELVLLQRLRTGSMTAVLRPDPGSELRVELRRRQGTIEIRATVERGDSRAISEGWPELQQQLRGQGIHLHSLEREPIAPSQRGSTGNADDPSPQSGGRGRHQHPAPEAGPWAQGRPGRFSNERGPSDRSSAPSTARPPNRLLESWA